MLLYIIFAKFGFDESIDKDEKDFLDRLELKDFVESCLVYLLDEGFNVFIPKRLNVLLPGYKHLQKSSDDDTIVIWLALSNQEVSLRNTGAIPYTKDHFTWDQIKDHYIPFLKLLSNRYDIVGFGEPSRGIEDSTSQVRFRLQPEYSNVAFKDFPLSTVMNDTLFGSYSDKQSIYSVGIMIKEKR